MTPTFSDLAEAQYLLLTTFTKDGRPKPVPIWAALDTDRGDRLLVITEKKSWKVKRIRNTPRVTLATCTLRGRPTSEAVEATAAILDESQTGAVYDAIVKRYGIQGKLFTFVSKLRGGMRNNIGLELKVAQARRRDAEPQGARGCVALPAPTRLSSLTMSTNPGPAEGANQVMAQEHSAGAVQFTAHNVRLDDGTLTIPESSRTLDESSWFISARGILETVFPGDKSHLRLADVGCLEGGYAVGFARMGFQVLGIEVRELNMAACNYIKSKTNLPNLRFVHDNALNIANHGLFDTVFCCGLFYHLENPKQYLETLSSVTNKLLILQTHFSIINRSDKWLRLPTTARQLTDRLLRRPAPVKFMLSAPTEHEGLPGRWFTEFSDDRSFGQRDTAKWASWDNRRSFWIQREHLLQAIKDVGVDLVMEEYDNLEPSIAESLLGGSYAANLRGTFIGIKTR